MQYPRFHETTHALVRIDRRDSDPTLSYAQEELVAAGWLCGVVGLDTSHNSIPYLTAWSQNTDTSILEHTAQLITGSPTAAKTRSPASLDDVAIRGQACRP